MPAKFCFNWSANGEFKKSLERISQKYRTQIMMFRSGDSGPLPQPTVSELITYGLRFPERLAASGQAWFYKMGTSSYDSIVDMPAYDAISFAAAENILQELAVLATQMIERRNRLSFILQRPEFFADADLSTLLDAFEQTTRLLNQIEQLARDCGQTPLGCKRPSLETLVNVKWPKMPDSSQSFCESERLLLLKQKRLNSQDYAYWRKVNFAPIYEVRRNRESRILGAQPCQAFWATWTKG